MNELEPLRGIPHELDASAKEWEQTPRIWVPNEKDGYALATVLAENANSDFFDVQICETGEKQRVSREDANKVNPLRYYKCEDMATMSCLNEPAVLYNLKQRYYQDLIYTYSGLFCVVINPYKHVKIYSDTIADCYKGRKRNEVPPHIFAVADEAYRNMLQNKEDQSILCTGESGAGKTENTKKLIQYLSHVAGSRKTKIDLDTSSTSGRSFVGHLEEQLLYANPILEAFGNSKTVKNDNSSRFGKFVRIHFDTAGYISGANIEFYLLEKSRVLRQAVQERSFHIFYQLIRGASKTMREELLLEHSPAKYRFLTNGDLAIPGVSDAKELQNTMDAMSIMGFSEDEIKSVFRVLSALLLFGNLEFASEGSNSDQARITNDSVLQKIAKLLHVNFDDLQRAILKPRIKVNREHTHRSQNEEQARFAVDAIAKATYERVFRWLVKRLNRSLDRTRQNAATFIGILDIAGFEIFERNSFEQLCINYTNEKLQQLFNSTMFVREQEEYLAEGIEWTMIDFGLNLQPTIDLIDKHLGVLSTLDDICLFPCGDDKSFVSKLTVQHQNHPKFIVPDMRSKNDFAIVHYAGRVDYSASEWRVKNMDPLNENVVEVLQVSKDMLVAEIWKDTTDMWKMCATEKDNVFGQRLKKGLFHTVSQLYKEQLSSLMATLNNTNPHFVRCIIPNHEKKAGVINGPLVLEQLRCNGVLEGIRIFRQGFPNRIPFQEFRQRYGKLLVPNAIPHEFIDGREAAQRIAIALDIDVKLYRIGQSKIFFRSGVVAELEILRDQKLAEFVVLFQAAGRGSLARMRFQRMREQTNALNIIQRNGRSWMRLRNWNWWKLYTKVLPIVTANMKNEKIEEMESELADTREKLRKAEAVCTELTLRIGTIEEDRDSVQQLYDRACLESNDASDELRRLANRNKDLNTQIDELTNQLMSEEKHRQIAEVEHLKIFESLGKLEKRLAAEEDDKKKLIDEKKAVEETLKELEDSKLGADETSAKLVKEKQQLEVRFKEVSERLNDAVRKIEELQDMVETLRKELNSTKRELQEASIRFSTELSDKIEELRKKYSRELQEANARAEHEAAARSKAEKAMTKARQECDDLSRELSEMTIQNKVYERKQHRFDQQFAEEKRATDVLQETVNSLEQQNRTLQSKLLSINNDIDSKNMAIESLEKEKRRLVAEIDSLTSQDAGANNPVELQKTKRRLEDEVATLTAEVEDLQDALGICETEKQRIEVKYQAARTGWDHQQRMRESEEDTGSRQLQQKLRAIEEQLEDERRRRTSALSNKTKIEQECKSLQDEIDAINTENSKLKNKLSRLEDKYRLTVSEAENYKVLHSNELASVERMNKLYQKTRTDLRAAEDDLVSEVQKCREARHQILDLEEKVDTLSREVQQLQTRLKTEKRLSLITYGGVGRSRYGSSTSLNRVDETLNSEDSPRAPSRVFADDDGESVLSYHG